MAYPKTDWMDGQTVVNEANLDKMEAGIAAAHVTADAAVPTSTKGQPNGVPSLDATGKVPASQLPPAPAGITWKGAYSAATSYVAGDIISYNGRYWLAAQPSSGSTPS